VNPLADAIEQLGLTSVWTFLGIFLAASLLMVWRLEALLDHGLEGTALGTLIMPYCSGLGNLIFVGLIAAGKGPASEVLTNCLVNNVTNLTLILGLPALFWGLHLAPPVKKKAGRGATGKSGGGGTDTATQITRLSLLLTLVAGLFFAGVTWALGSDGELGASDGLVLIALFLFWQSFQVYDVLKHNIRQQQSFGPMFYLDAFIVLLGAGALYFTIDWLMTWLLAQKGGFINAQHLGWLSGWLMVMPNALLAFFFAARHRADVAYASQIGDGHICIPLCLGLSALLHPIALPGFFETGIILLGLATFAHVICVLATDGLPRWMGWPLLAGYAWFLAAGLG
jgi:cation:H+ antiporter